MTARLDMKVCPEGSLQVFFRNLCLEPPKVSVCSFRALTCFNCVPCFKVAVDVPSTLNAEMVRFKWKQENFENALEYWALDDVRVSG